MHFLCHALIAKTNTLIKNWMQLFRAKKIFQKEGIKILEGHVAYSPEEAVAICSEMIT